LVYRGSHFVRDAYRLGGSPALVDDRE